MGTDEFFIGWQGKSPPGIGRFLRRRSILLMVIASLAAGVVAAMQGTIGNAFFEFGKIREFSGVLLKEPVPMLVANEPDEASGASVYYLVNPLKFGFDPAAAETFHLQQVALKGTLIYREDGQAMIEVVSDSVTPADGAVDSPLGTALALGEVTLQGEIVDSKCYLGVMNPGLGKPHRACAIRCISGGVPPVLVVKNDDGQANYFILLNEHGGAVNQQVLDYVALPIQIRGEGLKLGDRLVLKAALDDYTLLD